MWKTLWGLGADLKQSSCGAQEDCLRDTLGHT